jgi:hypothetical protein
MRRTPSAGATNRWPQAPPARGYRPCEAEDVSTQKIGARADEIGEHHHDDEDQHDPSDRLERCTAEHDGYDRAHEHDRGGSVTSRQSHER